MGPAHRSTVDELSAKYMVPIRRTVFSCFMLRDGEPGRAVCEKSISHLLIPI
jgi:hypothetical protein